MTPARPRSSGASIAGSVICVIAGTLLLIAFVVLTAGDDGWSDVGTSGRWALAMSIAACIALVVVSVVALVTRGAFSDVLLLGATGWALAWSAQVGPAQLPFTIEYGGEYSGGNWFAWGTFGLWVALGVAALLLLIGVATTLRTAVLADGGGAGGVEAVGGAAGPGAGWHADPAGTPGVERWWDGDAWTTHTR